MDSTHLLLIWVTHTPKPLRWVQYHLVLVLNVRSLETLKRLGLFTESFILSTELICSIRDITRTQ